MQALPHISEEILSANGDKGEDKAMQALPHISEKILSAPYNHAKPSNESAVSEYETIADLIVSTLGLDIELDISAEYEKVSDLLESVCRDSGSGEFHTRYRFEDESAVLLYPPFWSVESGKAKFLSEDVPEDANKGGIAFTLFKAIHQIPYHKVPLRRRTALIIKMIKLASDSCQSTKKCERYIFSDASCILMYPASLKVDALAKNRDFFEDQPEKSARDSMAD